MHLPIRIFLLASLLAGAAACQTHDRVIYATRTPKNLRVQHPGDTPDVPLETTPVGGPKPGAVTPATGGPSLPAAAQ